ncbi:MAG: hypothetical protein F6K39_36020 [Okeania sp. SIO3B3]|nr:hypothetical protein [Okeania sp. SIO3B3]
MSNRRRPQKKQEVNINLSHRCDALYQFYEAVIESTFCTSICYCQGGDIIPQTVPEQIIEQNALLG